MEEGGMDEAKNTKKKKVVIEDDNAGSSYAPTPDAKGSMFLKDNLDADLPKRETRPKERKKLLISDDTDDDMDYTELDDYLDKS
jgi:hypothetical protein